jgi:6-phosphogluconolactonase (cycloisomerase 2 family)
MDLKYCSKKIIFQILLLCFGTITHLSFSQKLEYRTHLKDSSTVIEHMSEPFTMVVSPDDKYVYVSSYAEKSLLLFERQPAGTLQWKQTYHNNVNGYEGLDGINTLTISPDGKSLYIASGNVLAVYNRDEISGKINFLEIHKDGVNGVDGLWMNVNVRVSPDNKYVYTLGFRDHAVTVFARDPSTGLLTFLQHRADGVDDVEGLYQPVAFVVSSDNQHLYIVGNNNSLTVFKREEPSGTLSFVDTYIYYETSPEFLEVPPTAIAISEAGDFVYVSSEEKHTLLVFARNISTGTLSLVQSVEKVAAVLPELNAPSILRISADGKYLYVGSYLQSAVLVFEINPTAGTVAYKASVSHPTTLSAATFELTQDGQNLYQVNLDESLLVVYDASSEEGLYEWRMDYKNEAETVHIDGLEGAWFILPTADDKHVYVVGGDEHSFSLFNRNSDGTLTFVQAYKSTMPGLESLTNCIGAEISPDGNFVVVISAVGNHLTFFAREPSTGLLTYLTTYTNGEDGIEGMTYPSSVAFSADGRNVYVSSFLGSGGGVVVFSRDAHTGALTYQETYKNGTGDWKLSNACHVRISHDDQYVYVLANGDNAINVFSRTPATGQLTLLGVYQNGTDDVQGMIRPNYFSISPDGDYLYITCYISNSVVMFAIDQATGTLTYGATYQDGNEGIENLLRPENCVMDPSGKYLFVSSASAVHTFVRDPATGALQYYDGLIAENIFISASFVAVSGNGNYLYLTSGDAHTLSVWTIVALPEAPTGLVAEAVGEAIELRWETSLPALEVMQYNIYRSTDPSVHTATKIDLATQNAYQDVSAVANTIYYYWVTLVHTNGEESIWSAPDTAILITTGVLAGTFSESLLAYPNPTSDRININLSDPSLLCVEVYNQQQQLMKKVSAHNFLSENSIDLSALPAGIYMIKFVGEARSRIVRVSKN